jgi:hypothetical protein
MHKLAASRLNKLQRTPEGFFCTGHCPCSFNWDTQSHVMARSGQYGQSVVLCERFGTSLSKLAKCEATPTAFGVSVHSYIFKYSKLMVWNNMQLFKHRFFIPTSSIFLCNGFFCSNIHLICTKVRTKVKCPLLCCFLRRLQLGETAELVRNESSNNAIDCFTLLPRIPGVPDSNPDPQDRLVVTEIL